MRGTFYRTPIDENSLLHRCLSVMFISMKRSAALHYDIGRLKPRSHDTTCSNLFNNLLDNRLYRVYKHKTGC